MGKVKNHNIFTITVEIEVDSDEGVQMRSVLAKFDSVMRKGGVPDSWIITKQAIKTRS